ncbi:MAG TPA: glycosyltransferase family 2 protein [Methanomassiliicoccales archaeon]|nr:glycosyltransferase family 2 protein [Methanomassiliicoccales archaeon]
MPKIVVLIPAFNEEIAIATVVTLSRRFAEHVIVVDDGSTDRTSLVAQLAGAEVIPMPKNRGKAKALVVGFLRCLELEPDCVVTIDGDMQLDPVEIPNLAGPVLQGKADMVIGSRFQNGNDGIPTYRRTGQKILDRATNISSGTNISDSQSGYRAFSLKALKQMNFSLSPFSVESEMIMRFNEMGLKIEEVPISVRYDVPNGHKMSPFRHGISVFSDVVGFIGYRRPLLLFGVPGGMLTLIGLVLGLFTWLDTIVIFQWALLTQSIAALGLLLVGGLMGVAGLILNSLAVLMADKKRK